MQWMLWVGFFVAAPAVVLCGYYIILGDLLIASSGLNCAKRIIRKGK